MPPSSASTRSSAIVGKSVWPSVWQSVWLIFAAALVLRIAAGFWWQHRLGDQDFAFGDSESYWHLAGDIAAGEPYSYGKRYHVFRTPGYPLLLSPLHMTSSEPSVLGARMLNSLLGLLAVAAAMWTARELAAASGPSADLTRKTSWLAGWIAALYPGAVAMSVFVLSEAPFAPCLMLQLACQLRSMRDTTASPQSHSRAWSIATGAMGGVATLMRPSWLLFTPGLAGWELLRRRFAWDAWARAGCMAAGLCVVMLPWWIRNYRTTDHMVVTTLQLGASLMDGLGPQADGSSDMRFAEEAYLKLKNQWRAEGRGIEGFEYELNLQLRDESIRWTKANLPRAFELSWIKFKRMWSVWPNSRDFGSVKLKLLLAAGYLPLLALGLVGAWGMRRSPLAWILMLPAGYLTLLHVIFVSSVRYRQPALLAIAPLAAIGLLRLGSVLTEKPSAEQTTEGAT